MKAESHARARCSQRVHRLLVCIAIAGGVPAPLAAHATNVPLAVCGPKFAGTYLLKGTTQGQKYTQLIIFTPAGAVSATPLAFEDGGTPLYTEGRGSWACVAKDENTVTAKATVLFIFYIGTPKQTYRYDYTLVFDKAQRSVHVSIQASATTSPEDPLLPPNLGPMLPLSATGQRVQANGPVSLPSLFK